MDPFTASGLVFAAITAGVIVKLNLTPIKVPQLAEWLVPPNIYVERSAPVTKEQVLKAVAKLEELGFKFGDMHFSQNVPGTRKKGAILITLRDHLFDEEHAGETRVIAENGFIESAVVSLPSLKDYEKESGDLYSDEERLMILTHELAHALGFKHVEAALFGRTKKGKPRLGLVGQKTGHLMHRHLTGMGWMTKGLKPPKA